MKQDYCTFFPEGSWQHCCKAHDKAYEMQVDKSVADTNLYNCVKESSDVYGIGLVATLMFIGISIFGRRFYKKAK